MKRLIALMSAAIIAAGMFTSCRKTYPYDTDKAISLATEYMKNKYGKDIKDIETYKKLMEATHISASNSNLTKLMLKHRIPTRMKSEFMLMVREKRIITSSAIII